MGERPLGKISEEKLVAKWQNLVNPSGMWVNKEQKGCEQWEEGRRGLLDSISR